MFPPAVTMWFSPREGSQAERAATARRRLDATCQQAGEPSDALCSARRRGGLERGLGGEQPSQAVGPRGAEAAVHAEQGGSHGVLQVRKLSGWLWVPRLEEPVRCLKYCSAVARRLYL